MVPPRTKRISLRSGIGQFDVEPQPDLSAFFAGRRVIFTLSKNNRLEWIQDWVRYHRDVHGADAVLFYDNQSSAYTANELAAALGELSGIERLCVVSWPFRYGPQGIDAKRCWDSDFCQYGALEHARRLFLPRARAAMNCDIDELVVSNNGVSAFEAAERSYRGVLRYHGYWVHGLRDITRPATADAPARFIDFDHYLHHGRQPRLGFLPVSGSDDVCAPKWTVVPSRCPDTAQWAPHRIKGWINALPLDRNFSFRHFREIGNHWKYDRSQRELFDPGRYSFDHLIRANFEAVRWTA